MKKYDNSIYTWGPLLKFGNRREFLISLGKLLIHFLIIGLFTFWSTLKIIYWWGIEEEIQLPKFAAFVASITLALLVEYVEMRISKALIDYTDILVAAAACALGWYLF